MLDFSRYIVALLQRYELEEKSRLETIRSCLEILACNILMFNDEARSTIGVFRLIPHFQAEFNLGHSEKNYPSKEETNNKRNPLTPPCRPLELSLLQLHHSRSIVWLKKTESYKELLSHDVRPPSRAQLYELAVSLFNTQEYDLLLLYFFLFFNDVFWSNCLATTSCFICLRYPPSPIFEKWNEISIVIV